VRAIKNSVGSENSGGLNLNFADLLMNSMKIDQILKSRPSSSPATRCRCTWAGTTCSDRFRI
jgi:hypothetical protein